MKERRRGLLGMKGYSCALSHAPFMHFRGSSLKQTSYHAIAFNLHIAAVRLIITLIENPAHFPEFVSDRTHPPLIALQFVRPRPPGLHDCLTLDRARGAGIVVWSVCVYRTKSTDLTLYKMMGTTCCSNNQGVVGPTLFCC